jgi:hypothetical protein
MTALNDDNPGCFTATMTTEVTPAYVPRSSLIMWDNSRALQEVDALTGPIRAAEPVFLGEYIHEAIVYMVITIIPPE